MTRIKCLQHSGYEAIHMVLHCNWNKASNADEYSVFLLPFCTGKCEREVDRLLFGPAGNAADFAKTLPYFYNGCIFNNSSGV